MYHAVKQYQKIGHLRLWNVTSSAATVLSVMYIKYTLSAELSNAK